MRRRHAVPNALLPVVTLIAINFGFVLSGCDRGGVDLLLARARPRDLQRDPGARPADAAGPVPGLQRVGDLLQPRRRPRLCLSRPAGANDMSTVAVTTSARRIAWTRRRRALARAARDYLAVAARSDRARGAGRHRRMAIAAPLIANHDNLDSVEDALDADLGEPRRSTGHWGRTTTAGRSGTSSSTGRASACSSVSPRR